MTPSSALPTQGRSLPKRRPHYRAVLEEQWRRQVATIVELSFGALDRTPDPSSGPDADEPHLRAAARSIAAARQQLEETEAALRRVDDGSFGRCGDCGGPVSPERLEILPAARYCVGCHDGRPAP